ncbi:MAG: amidohydrolase [Treponema sp.]|nr:amidohydrolase [Treponema sp.]
MGEKIELSKIKELSASDYDYLVKLRRDLHAHPELGLNEFRTAELIEHELDSFGIDYKRIGKTGVLGIIRGTSASAKSLSVLLRADIDALPVQEQNDVPYRSQTDGVMHACGHDVHTASLLGAAKILSSLKNQFTGEIRLVFQPAEEIGKGAGDFISAGVLEGVSRVFGLHTAPDLPLGTVGVKPALNNAAVDQFKIHVKGKSSHVSAPQLGVDALYIASQIVVALQAIVTRRTSPVEPVIIGVGKLNAGTTYNALAESAELEGTTRTISNESRGFIKQQVTNVVQQITALYGGKVQIEWDEFCPVVYNDVAVTEEVKDVIDRVFGEGHTTRDRALSLGGDNFADFIQTVPGTYAYLGTSNEKKRGTLNPVHSVNFDVDEDSLIYGSALYASYALWFLSEGTYAGEKK